MRYLLDTDIIIDYLRDYKPTVKKVDKLFGHGTDLYASVITNLELHAGESITQSSVLQKIDELFNQLSILDISSDVAGLAGDFRRIYKASVPDALIAASAKAVGATLLTRNIKHFSPIREIKIKEL